MDHQPSTVACGKQYASAGHYRRVLVVWDYLGSQQIADRCTYRSCDKFKDSVHITVCIKSTPMSFPWLAQGFDKLLPGLCGLFLGRVEVPTAHPFWVGRSLAHPVVSSVDQGDPGCSDRGKHHFLTSRSTPGLPSDTPSHQIIPGECSLVGNPPRVPSGCILSAYFI